MVTLGANWRVLVTGGSGFIGSNLIEFLCRAGVTVRNIDSRPVRSQSQATFHVAADLLDRPAVGEVARSFAPTHVVHLAARTELVDGKTGREYAANTRGTMNLVDAMREVGSVRRCIFASSKLVCRNGCAPPACGEFCPDTCYGQSKVEMERSLRTMGASCFDWCIVRPTSIWGPWFRTPYREFFVSVARRRYFHLGNQDPPRSFGYVGNVVHQISSLLTADDAAFSQEVFYLTDYECYSTRTWAEVIAEQLGATPIRTMPEPIVRLSALVGDGLMGLGWRNPPLSSFRLQNMRTDTSCVPVENLKAITGALPFTLEQGVSETIAWLQKQGMI